MWQPLNRRLASYDLKIIALVTMLLDHIAAIFFPGLFIFRLLGRMSFMLFSFLLVEGYFHSKNTKVYFFKLLLFALVSQPAYTLAFHEDWFSLVRLNVFFTLAAGVLTMMIMSSMLAGDLKVLFLYLMVVLSNYLRFDYFYFGILQIICFYAYRSNNVRKFLTVGILNLFYGFRITIQFAGVLAFIPIYLYNGKLGKRLGFLFYTLYPLHLLIFGIIKTYLLR